MPLAGELTSSLIHRAADRYGLPAAGVLRLWTYRNSPARNHGGGVRADAEIVLNEAGRAVLAEPCGVEPAVLAHALPAFTVDDPKTSNLSLTPTPGRYGRYLQLLDDLLHHGKARADGWTARDIDTALYWTGGNPPQPGPA